MAAKPTQDQIIAALEKHKGNASAAGRELGIAERTMRRYAAELKGTDAIAADDKKKRKLVSSQAVPGEISPETLHKSPEELMADYGLSPDEFLPVKLDCSERDGGTAASPKVNRAVTLTLQPIPKLPKPALEGSTTSFSARPKRKDSKDDVKTIVVLGDEQAPNGLDTDLHELVCQFLRDIQPDEVLHIGDLGDFESVSSYQQLNPGEWSNSVQDCIDASYQILGNYRANVPADTRFRYLIGNHEVRLQRYLLNQAKELWEISRAGEDERSVLDLAYLLRLDELDIELVTSDIGTYPHPAVELVPNKLIAFHGDTARRRSGTSPHAAGENLSAGVIHGHTHRAAVVSKTIRSTRKSYQLQSAEIGCLCKPNGLGYTSTRTTDWQQGFATVSVWPDGHYHIDLASYQNGALVWNGKRWTA